MLLIFDKMGAGREQLPPTRAMIGRTATLRGEVSEEVDMGTIRDLVFVPRGGQLWVAYVVFDNGTERGKWVDVDHGYAALTIRGEKAA